MLPFRKIVFPVDFSEACTAIVPYVGEMRDRNQAELTLLHAFDPAPAVFVQPGLVPMGGYVPLADLRGREESRLGDFAREHFPGLKPALHVMDGDPGGVITDFVNKQGADLVMMATAGHGLLRRFLLGSNTSKVLHDVSCAIWTGVRSSKPEYRPRVPYESIACAINTDDEAEAVLKAAAMLARAYSAKLRLVHAVETPPLTWEVDYAPYRKSLVDAADAYLRRLKSEMEPEATVDVLEGPLTETMHHFAVEHQVDLIVAGRGHSQGNVSRLWSQLYSMIRDSPCPILSV